MKVKGLFLFVLLWSFFTAGCAFFYPPSVYENFVATPTFSTKGGNYINPQNVSISCATPDAEIYYTIDGTTPTPSSTLFTTNLVINKNTTIKAIAVKSNMANSKVATATYTFSMVATPTFDPPGGAYSNTQSVNISCATPEATIYYTLDGTIPTSSSTIFTTNLSVFSNNTTIKAIAVKPGMTNSQVATATYTVRVATPTFSPAGGTYSNAQSVNISCATPGSKIYYTLDGTNPTPDSTLFTTNLVINKNTTIKAIAVKSGIEDSQIATATYTVRVATPTFSPAGGIYSNAQSVSISCATPGAEIYYTLDGTTPTPSNTLFTTNLVINENTIIKAIAVRSNMADSPVATATYTVRVATPTFSPSADTYSNTQSVSISCATQEAEIHYTLDGTSPTPSSTLFTINLVISNTTTIKAIAIKSNMANSPVATKIYSFLPLTWTESGNEVTITGYLGSPSSIVIPSTINGKPVTSIRSNAFTNCTGLTNVTFFTNLTSIGAGAFKGCTNLTYITLPDSLPSIGKEVFAGCTRLTNVTLPNFLTSIGYDAFDGCTGLTNVTLPNYVTSIGNSAFYNCTGLTSITLPNSITSIGNAAFYNCTGLIDVSLPNSLTSIGYLAFYGCTGLTNVTFPDSLTYIGDVEFSGCTGLTSISLPNSITYIGNEAFQGCTGLANVTLPNSLTNIRYEAFYGCTGLTNITLPNSITNIGTEVFAGCNRLTKITVKATNPPSLGGNAFCCNATGRKIYVPSGSLSDYQAHWSAYSSDITNY